ncbi:MAG: AAA family ATPase [Pseudomonadota bacterium]
MQLIDQERAQREVVSFLAAPETHNGATVECVTTHISRVFLAGDRAYKLKRALKYEFADFSTAERRRLACENELRVNRRAAPDLYLGVRPIYQDGCGASWRESGPPVDWVVEMARFASTDQFDRLLIAERLDDRLVWSLADKLFDLHQKAPICRARATARDPAANANALVEDLRRGALRGSRKADIDDWAMRAAAAFHSFRDLIEARFKDGRVRRCHGDLHLANICLFQGEVTPFDAIEFDDEVATIDVLYDLAFAAVDFAHFKRPQYANGLVNRYFGRSGDYGGLALLPAFASMRAIVRAMALGLAAKDPDGVDRAGDYLDLGLELLRASPRPRLIAIGGLSGSGKSTLARALAPGLGSALGAVAISSDVVRKRLFGVAPETSLDASAYRRDVTTRVYAQMLEDAEAALRAGAVVILDATYTNDEARGAARRLAERRGARFDGVWLTAPVETLKGRVAARSHDASDATLDVVAQQALKTVDLPSDWLTPGECDNVDAMRDTVLSMLNIASPA